MAAQAASDTISFKPHKTLPGMTFNKSNDTNENNTMYQGLALCQAG